ncbi:unnamed protein product [Cuscuta epithymum]|uniref:Uncharacterized protein n=1 Tax=Cuscuta epithymum TaxID=186058 RepID=A0AAV0DQ09_9ASTE|nr:unnamed protein product [Cuscuta epithymum]
METAINIGYACSLPRPGMKLMLTTLDSPQKITLESQEEKDGGVTALVKGSGGKTLAIGYGADDVSMLQEADVGVRVSWVEGMQVFVYFLSHLNFPCDSSVEQKESGLAFF